MTVPSLTAYPDPAPSRSDAAATFITRANSKVAHDIVIVDEMNSTVIPAINADVATVADAATTLSGAAVAAVDSTDYAGSSTSSLTLATGSKTVVLAEAGKAFAANDFIVAIYRPDPEIRLFMTVNSVVSQTLTCTVPSGGVFGTGGPYANWLVIHAAFLGSGATAAMIWEGTSEEAPVSPATLADAAEPQTLTDGATINWDMNLGWNAKVTLGGNLTMAAPTNAKAGQTYALEVIQDGTGSRTVTWNACFKFGAAGTPVLSTTAAKRDIFFCYCYDAATPAFRVSASFDA